MFGLLRCHATLILPLGFDRCELRSRGQVLGKSRLHFARVVPSMRANARGAGLVAVLDG